MKRPPGVTAIAVLMFVSAAATILAPSPRLPVLGTIRGPWLLILIALYIALGVGLLKQLQWARLITIAITILRFSLLQVGLIGGILQKTKISVISYFVGSMVSGAIAWYLLGPEIASTFGRTTKDVRALSDF